jgi:hypothetical protein
VKCTPPRAPLLGDGSHDSWLGTLLRVVPWTHAALRTEADAERGCIESDEINRSNESEHPNWKFPPAHFEVRLRVRGHREMHSSPCSFARGRFTRLAARDIAAGGPLDTRRAPQRSVMERGCVESDEINRSNESEHLNCPPAGTFRRWPSRERKS